MHAIYQIVQIAAAAASNKSCRSVRACNLIACLVLVDLVRARPVPDQHARSGGLFFAVAFARIVLFVVMLGAVEPVDAGMSNHEQFPALRPSFALALVSQRILL